MSRYYITPPLQHAINKFWIVDDSDDNGPLPVAEIRADVPNAEALAMIICSSLNSSPENEGLK